MKELKPKEWIPELDSAFEYRERYGLEKTWAENEALFSNVQESQDNPGPNIVFSILDSFLASVDAFEPYWQVSPQTFNAVEAAPLVERLVNNFYVQQAWKEIVLDASLSAQLYGTGFLKFGYDSQYGWDPSQEFEGMGLSMSMMSKKGQRIEFGQAQPGMPWIEPVLPHDILLPYGTFKCRTAEWIAHRVVRHIDAINEDPKYENTSGLQPTMSEEDYQQSYVTMIKPHRMGWSPREMGSGKNEPKYCELWEIHDRRTGKVYVISQDYERFIRNDIDYLQIDGLLPFIELGFVPTNRSVWRTPDAFFLKMCQEELSDTTVQARNNRRLSVLKFAYLEGSIDTIELMKALSRQPGMAFKINQGNDLKNAIVPFQPYHNPMIYTEMEEIRRNAREVSGISRNQAGEYEPRGRRSATETAAVQQGGEERKNRKLAAVARAYQEMGRRTIEIIRKFWKMPQLVQVMGPEGMTWMSFVASKLQGSYSYNVKLGNPQAEQQLALSLYQALSQDPAIDQLELRRYLAGALNDPRIDKLWKPGIMMNGAQNGSLPIQMQQMQGGPRRGTANGGPQQNQTMPQMQARGA